MGFFGKIKDNFNHGGVDISLQAADVIPSTGGPLPVTVTLISDSNAQTVKSVSAAVVAMRRNRSDNRGASGSTQGDRRTLGAAEKAEIFILNPNEPRTIELVVDINGQSNLADILASSGAVGALGGALQKIGEVTEKMGMNDWYYELQVRADDDGIALDPSVSQTVRYVSTEAETPQVIR